MIKPKLKLTRQSDNALLEAARAVRNAMTTNAARFPDSTATVTALGTALTAYAASLQTAADGKIAQQALVDAKDGDRDTVEHLLRALAGQVSAVAKGDLNLIHDAGMATSSGPTPVSMSQVLNLRLARSEHEGELLAAWEPMHRARYYQVQVCLDTETAPTNWLDKTTSTKAKCRLNDTLVSGQKVWARVRAVGANDAGAWSDVACKTVP